MNRPLNLRGTSTESRYYRWLTGMPCCLSARTDRVQRAHTGGLSEGKGMSRKAPLWTVLPLYWSLHAVEERQRKRFWGEVGIEPIPHAERLFDMFEVNDRTGAELMLADMHEAANLEYLAEHIHG